MACASGKVRYRDKLGAQMALARTLYKDRGECRLYRCPDCRGWHLTSRPARGRRTYGPRAA